MSDDASTWPRRYQSAAGLAVEVNANGSIRRMEHGNVVLNLFPASEMEGGPTNLYLRLLGDTTEWAPLLGPRSPLAFRIDDEGLSASGEWRGLRVSLALVLAESTPAWFWHVAVESPGASVGVDLVYAQDVAVAPYGAIRMNEYYVSQYLDHTPLPHAQRGHVVATRQNLSVDERIPWTVIGSLRRGVGFATDALQLHGLRTRTGEGIAALETAALPAARQQHEHAMVVIQDAAVRLDAGGRADLGFFGWLEPDHPAATSGADLAFVDRAVALPEAQPPLLRTEGGVAPAPTLFSTCATLACRDLTTAEISQFWSGPLRHAERDGDRLLSFFSGDHTHVVLREKERRVLRPHGALLRTGAGLTPDEASLTTTVWMSGVFNSLLTQGHVSINRFLSTTRSYLGLQRAHGQRLFVEAGDGYRLLGEPSAWEVRPESARWLYAHDGGTIEVAVVAGAAANAIELRIAVLAGAPARFLLSNHVALNGDDGSVAVPARWQRDDAGIAVRAIPDSDVGRRFPEGTFRIDPQPGTEVERVGGDELLFADGRSRREPFVTLVTAPVRQAGIRMSASLVADASTATLGDADRAVADRFWAEMASPRSLAAPASPRAADVARLREILPWFAHDALIHYLAPRGLEQYSGGGWGTRDVAQGPIELLLALGRWDAMRDLLLRLFANQNADGDWPQWFMFFERERGIRPAESHGDIVFWPPHALAEYLLASGDAAILDEIVPFFHPDGDAAAEHASVWAHVERALALIEARMIPGTRLVSYGHGDWNDSLQPAHPEMRERLCSTWTVILHHETATKLARALRALGRNDEAGRLDASASAVRADFARLLMPDGELAGFAYFGAEGRVDHLLHPRDRATGIHHRLLPMIHAIIADLLTPEQAAAHVALMRAHLLGADGARLFDHPPMYRGGPQEHFQRAESSTFFGREIGLMYTHAHLRYAEAMARWGDAHAFFEALRRANPIGISSVVATAAPRQSNCYYSSSDAVVADRYEAATRYAEIRAGRVRYEGGWRVYSSGAGIAYRLVHQCFLGFRHARSFLGIDPVVPKALDGLRAVLRIEDREVEVQYKVASRGCGPKSVTLNGAALPLTRTSNPYRTPGVTVPLSSVQAHLRDGDNSLVIELE